MLAVFKREKAILTHLENFFENFKNTMGTIKGTQAHTQIFINMNSTEKYTHKSQKLQLLVISTKNLTLKHLKPIWLGWTPMVAIEAEWAVFSDVGKKCSIIEYEPEKTYKKGP